MKTTAEKKTKLVLKNRPEPRSTANPRQIDFRLRAANRSLDTAKLLDLLKQEKPQFFELAEVVGNWVWIQFAAKKPTRAHAPWPSLAFIGIMPVWRGNIPAAYFSSESFAN